MGPRQATQILPHNYRIKFMERPRDLDALIVLSDVGGRGELGFPGRIRLAGAQP